MDTLPLDSSPGSSRAPFRPTAGSPDLPGGVFRLDLPPSWPLEHGGAVADGHLAYEIVGPAGAPLLVVAGGISASCHITATDRCPEPGWWQALVGPGRPIDTRTFRVLGFDFLGGNGASSGPGKLTPPRPRAFPCISTFDQARALAYLLDALDIERCAGFVGASYGGMVGLAFAALYPRRLGKLIAISAADHSHPQSTAWRTVQRKVVHLAKSRGAEAEGLALARSLAMVTYRSPMEMAQRFADAPRATDQGFSFPVEAYLDARGRAFAESFAADAFLCLSQSIDLHRIDPKEIEAPTTLVSVSSDQLVPARQIAALSRRITGPTRLVEIPSIFGHDAFLKETETLGLVLRGFLTEEETC